MARQFKQLRIVLLDKDLTQGEVSEMIGKSRTYLSKRMRGEIMFSVADIIAVATVLELPKEHWLDVFFPESMVQLCGKV